MTSEMKATCERDASRGCWNCVNWSGNPLIDEYAVCDEDFNRHARLHVCLLWKSAVGVKAEEKK